MTEIGPPLVPCPLCGGEVPEGEYCGACGAHLPTGSRFRHGAYAANPGESAFHLSIVSTLFPHLPERQSTIFRAALLAFALLLLALGVFRLTGPAIAVAGVAVPLLYLLYVWEVDVYEDDPIVGLALTFVVSLALGWIWAQLTGRLVTGALLEDVTIGVDPARVFVAAVLLPLAAQAVMLVGPVLLYFLRPRYRHALDGFAFGVMSALAFALSNTFVNLWPELHSGLISTIPAVDNTLVVLERGILIPLINAGATGLIAGALWLHRAHPRQPHRATSLPVAIAIPVVLWVILGFINVFVLDPGLAVIAYVVAGAALLFWVRLALHYMLLAEAGDTAVGPDIACQHCHHLVPRMAFCPQCGIASSALPKTRSQPQRST